jgi:hypothetical protein
VGFKDFGGLGLIIGLARKGNERKEWVGEYLVIFFFYDLDR